MLPPFDPEILNFGRASEGNSHRREDHYEASDTLAVSRGHHLIKSGLVVNRVRLNSYAPDAFGAVYIFPSLTDFLDGAADSFRQAFGDPSSYAVTGYGTLVQEHWSLGERVTADLGVRYDFERLPARFHRDASNFIPRIGLAYSPSSGWVLRAGFGLFYDRYVLANLNRAIDKDGGHSSKWSMGKRLQAFSGRPRAGRWKHRWTVFPLRYFDPTLTWLRLTANKPACKLSGNSQPT